jgi:hypothetical protein
MIIGLSEIISVLLTMRTETGPHSGTAVAMAPEGKSLLPRDPVPATVVMIPVSRLTARTTNPVASHRYRVREAK